MWYGASSVRNLNHQPLQRGSFVYSGGLLLSGEEHVRAKTPSVIRVLEQVEDVPSLLC